jgi:multicomponent Na+:H+ antiporter subunit G
MSKVSAVLYVIGVLFNLLGAFGLLRLPDIYNRLQAATKCVTLGTCMILLGVFIDYGISSLGAKALICLVFILFTSPTAAHAISRGSHIFGIRLWKGSSVDKLAEDESEK